jgi:anti-sigma factor RsiW
VSEFQRLEMELAHHLGPVAAPEALWDRIHEQRTPRRGTSFRLWPIAAALLLMGSGGIAWRISLARDPVSNMEKLAERELNGLAGSPQELNLRSEDPLEIRTWVKAKTNIDIELPGGGAVRLLGARLIRLEGTPIAVVAYKVGDSSATLFVCRKRSAAGGNQSTKHVFSRVDARLFTWSMREQVYTIASPSAKDPQAACLLCHADPAPGGILKVTRRL